MIFSIAFFGTIRVKKTSSVMINNYKNGGLNMVGTASFTKITQDCLDFKVP